MGVFDDKKFEKLDWMTQITETIDSELNGVLARLPNEVDLTYNDLLSCLRSSYYMSISLGKILNKYVEQISEYANLSYEEKSKIEGCFELEISEDFMLDCVNETVTGSVKLIKSKPTLEDEDLQSMMGRQGIESLNYCSYKDDPASLSRLNEVIEIIDAPLELKRNRSVRKKVKGIASHLRLIFKENKWRIRDMELANKVGLWCRDYASSGNLAALTNLCKLKVMTHNNMPIYSIEEEKL